LSHLTSTYRGEVSRLKAYISTGRPVLYTCVSMYVWYTCSYQATIPTSWTGRQGHTARSMPASHSLSLLDICIVRVSKGCEISLAEDVLDFTAPKFVISVNLPPPTCFRLAVIMPTSTVLQVLICHALHGCTTYNSLRLAQSKHPRTE
jgi:hypothetical protein